MPKKVVIVGAGPGGLATAMRLAAAGYAVTIYEARKHVGGRMAGFENGPYAFDTGPTILQLPQLYEQLYADCGLRMQEYLRLLRVDPNTRLHYWDGSQLDLTTDTAAFKRQLAQIRPDLPLA